MFLECCRLIFKLVLQQHSTIVLSDDDDEEALPSVQGLLSEPGVSSTAAATAASAQRQEATPTSDDEARARHLEPDTDDDDDDDEDIIVLSASEQTTSREASSGADSSIVHFNAGSAIVEDMCVTRLRSHLYVAAVTDGACLVFQASTGRLLRKHKKVDGVAVTAVAESSQGAYYIATSSGTVQSYQVKSGQQLHTYNCRKTAVSCMRASGDFLVVGTKSGCIYVFHVLHKQPVLVFQDHGLSITGLQVRWAALGLYSAR